MKDFDPLGSYFAVTLGVSRGAQPFCSTQTHWVGWSERNPGWEIRAASLVDPRLIIEMWDIIGRAGCRSMTTRACRSTRASGETP